MGIWNEVASLIVKLINAVLAVLLGEIALPWVKTQMIPWLRERRLERIVAVAVQAAEKLASSGQIDKKDKYDYVVGVLEHKHIAITPETRAFIESAVYELDNTIMGGAKKIADELTKEI